MSDRRAHKHAVRRAFDRAAGSYDTAADVQRVACDRLKRFAAAHAPATSAQIALDAGCGTGYGLKGLAELCPSALLVALDFAPAMLRETREARGDASSVRSVLLCGDLEALPFAAGSVDAVWSSLALQWCEPRLVFAELTRSLRGGGVGWIATLGPRTLWELRAAFAEVDEAEHVLQFHAAPIWQGAAADAGLECVAAGGDTVAALAPDLRALLRSIKAIGAQTVTGGRRRTTMGKAAWQRLELAYERYRREDGLLPASYDLIFLAVRKP